MRLFDAIAAFPQTEEEIIRRIEEMRKSKSQFMFGLRCVSDNTLVGMGGFDEISWRNRAGWLAIALGREHWGQGYGTEAAQLLLRYAFMELNLHRVQLTVFEYNERALTLSHRLGFQHEGTFREMVWRDGRRYDMILMGLLASEWQETTRSV